MPLRYYRSKMSAAHNRPAPNLVIRSFRPGDEAAFRALNEAWISRYFRLEPADEKVLSNPLSTIIDPGGQIIFALVNDLHVGCCALLPTNDTEFEVAKMAVSTDWQGRGIGRAVLAATIDKAREMGAKRLYLETNHQLAPAIHLYEALGFRHVPKERLHASPYARADVFLEMFL
jgi:GNAT superfamily N-acetyltransferase